MVDDATTEVWGVKGSEVINVSPDPQRYVSVRSSSDGTGHRTLMEVVRRCVLDEVSVRIIDHLALCPGGRDYLSRISHRCSVPMTTVRRRMARLVDARLVSRVPSPDNAFRYFQLTPLGLTVHSKGGARERAP